METVFTDFNFDLYLGHPFFSGVAHVHFVTHICSTYAVSPFVRISQVRRQIQGQLSQPYIFMSRSILLHDLCPDNISRKSSGYRSVFECDTKQTLSSWIQMQKYCSEYNRICKREQRLANICRLCSDTNQSSSKTIFSRRYWHTTEQYGLRTRLNYHRSMHVSLSMGKIPDYKISNKGTYVTGSTRLYTSMDKHYARSCTRRKHSGRTNSRARLFLCDGQRLYRFQEALQVARVRFILRDSCKEKHQTTTTLHFGNRQIDWTSVRSDSCIGRFLFNARLSRKTSKNQILRCRTETTICIHHKQLYSSGNHDSITLQKQMESRIILQMDKIAPKNKVILRYIRKCGQDTDMDSNLNICYGSNPTKRTEDRTQSVFNSTNFERVSIRANRYKSITYGFQRGGKHV